MPKARKSRRRKAARASRRGAGAPETAPKRRYKAAVYSVLLGIGVFGGVFIWRMQACEAAFLDLAGAHRDTLERVRTMPNLGRAHLPRGQRYRYPDPFPTSGPHAPVWRKPGVYTDPQPDVQLVHALEHGNVVIYVDRPADDVVATLERWANLYAGPWSGIIVTPRRGLGQEVVLTAWRKILRLKTFDAGAAAAFIDAYRGRGPEHPVR